MSLSVRPRHRSVFSWTRTSPSCRARVHGPTGHLASRHSLSPGEPLSGASFGKKVWP